MLGLYVPVLATSLELLGACAAGSKSKDIQDSRDSKDNGETETSLLSLLSLRARNEITTPCPNFVTQSLQGQ